MKPFLFILFVFPLMVFGQLSDSVLRDKITVGISYSPDYCYRILKTGGHYRWMRNYRNMIETPKWGYTTGFNFNYSINKRFSIGIAYFLSDKGEKVTNYHPDFVLLPWQTQVPLPISISYIYHYIYIDVPVKGYYYFRVKRASIYASAGVSTNLFLAQKTKQTMEFPDGRKATSTFYTNPRFMTFNFAALAGLGGSYEVTKKIIINAEPIVRCSITSIVDAPVKGYLISGGLTLGLNYKW